MSDMVVGPLWWVKEILNGREKEREMTLKEDIKKILEGKGHDLFDFDYGIHDFVINENEMNAVIKSIMNAVNDNPLMEPLE